MLLMIRIDIIKNIAAQGIVKDILILIVDTLCIQNISYAFYKICNYYYKRENEIYLILFLYKINATIVISIYFL